MISPIPSLFLLMSFLAPQSSTLQQAAPPSTRPAQSLPDSPKPDPDGVYRIGNGVSAPKPLVMPDPEFTEKARKKKISGNCRLSLIVNADGTVKDVKVIRSITEGQSPKLRAAAEALDQKAVEAVRQYRFEPAVHEGKPVPVTMVVEVNFQIF